MTVLTCVCVLLGLSTASANFYFSYSDCSKGPNKVVHIEDGHIQLYSLHIPETETGDVILQVLRNVSGSHYRLDVQIQKHVSILGYITLPCLSNIGSCSYDLCTLLSQYNGHCPIRIEKSKKKSPCSCPFVAGSYHLNPAAFNIPNIRGLSGWLLFGDYKALAHITDTRTEEEVGCFKLQLSVARNCIGLACLIG